MPAHAPHMPCFSPHMPAHATVVRKIMTVCSTIRHICGHMRAHAGFSTAHTRTCCRHSQKRPNFLHDLAHMRAHARTCRRHYIKHERALAHAAGGAKSCGVLSLQSFPQDRHVGRAGPPLPQCFPPLVARGPRGELTHYHADGTRPCGTAEIHSGWLTCDMRGPLSSANASRDVWGCQVCFAHNVWYVKPLFSATHPAMHGFAWPVLHTVSDTAAS